MKRALVKFPSPRCLAFSADCIEKYCLLSLAKSKSGPFLGKKETGKIVGGGNLPLLSLLYRLTAIYCDKDDTVMFYVHIVLLLFSKTFRYHHHMIIARQASGISTRKVENTVLLSKARSTQCFSHFRGNGFRNAFW